MEARSGQNCNNKIVIIKLPHKSVFSATVVLFISLLCIFIGGTNFFFEVVAYYF